MGAGIGVERKCSKAADFGKRCRKIVIDLQRTLCRLYRSFGVQCRKRWQCTDFLIETGIVLHCTAAKRVEACVYTKVLVREVRIMAHHIKLGHFREFRFALTFEITWQATRTISILENILWKGISSSALF